MAKLDVFNLKREKVGEIELSDDVFGAEVKEHLFYEVVKAQLASRAPGTQAAKERSAVSGSHARSSTSRRAPAARVTARSARPIYVGGGQAHPPRPRDWCYRPPRQVRIGALTSALSLFAKEGRLIVVDSFELAEIKTKALVGALGDAQGRQEGAGRRRSGQREARSSRSATAETTSSCRPRASTSTTSSGTTT